MTGNTNALEDLVTRVRHHYLAHLIAGSREARAEHPDGVVEVMFELGQGEIPSPYSLYRVDFFAGGSKDPKVIEFNRDSYLSFDPLELRLGEMSCAIHSFHWNGTEFHIDGLPSHWSAVEDWVRRAIDESDQHVADEDGFAGVIHGATAPAIDGDHWRTSIDFGSSPTMLLWDFLELLRKVGVRHVEVGSFSMIDSEASE